MPNPNPALLPSPALFDVTTIAKAPVEGTIERVSLDHLELAPNPRTHISHDSIQSLAALLMRTGQLIPCIGHRPNPNQPAVLLYDGQRRLLAANASHELAEPTGSKASRQSARSSSCCSTTSQRPRRPGASRPKPTNAKSSPFKTSSSSSPTAGTLAPACQTTTASSLSAPTSASPPNAPTTYAASSPSPSRSANASPSAPPASSSRSRWQTDSPTCTNSHPSSPKPSPNG